MDVGAHQQAVELILHDHLPIIGVGFAAQLRRHLLDPLLVLIGDRLDGELPAPPGRLQQKLPLRAQPEDPRGQHLLCHSLRPVQSTSVLTKHWLPQDR